MLTPLLILDAAVGKSCALEIGARHEGAADFGADEVGSSQVGSSQVGAS